MSSSEFTPTWHCRMFKLHKTWGLTWVCVLYICVILCILLCKMSIETCYNLEIIKWYFYKLTTKMIHKFKSICRLSNWQYLCRPPVWLPDPDTPSRPQEALQDKLSLKKKKKVFNIHFHPKLQKMSFFCFFFVTLQISSFPSVIQHTKKTLGHTSELSSNLKKMQHKVDYLWFCRPGRGLPSTQTGNHLNLLMLETRKGKRCYKHFVYMVNNWCWHSVRAAKPGSLKHYSFNGLQLSLHCLLLISWIRCDDLMRMWKWCLYCVI